MEYLGFDPVVGSIVTTGGQLANTIAGGIIGKRQQERQIAASKSTASQNLRAANLNLQAAQIAANAANQTAPEKKSISGKTLAIAGAGAAAILAATQL